uniref:Uncharacterized protein n=1 Tax=Brassica oleracea TaxID=3712 RepID=A0A3P6EX72_BRAOL|nr:unnamed protein product [Brassica oleracea]
MDFDPKETSELTNRQHPLRLQPPHYYLRRQTKFARNISKEIYMLLPSFLNCSAWLS